MIVIYVDNQFLITCESVDDPTCSSNHSELTIYARSSRILPTDEEIRMLREILRRTCNDLDQFTTFYDRSEKFTHSRQVTKTARIFPLHRQLFNIVNGKIFRSQMSRIITDRMIEMRAMQATFSPTPYTTASKTFVYAYV
jgi:hypothetical protein